MQKLHVNWSKVAEGLGLPLEDVITHFSDGRNIGTMIERILCQSQSWKRVDSELSPYDAVSNDGKVEIRCITKGGVSFSPSSNTGAGRSFSQKDLYEKKLDVVDFFALVNITDINNITYKVITSTQVKTWFEAGSIGKNAKPSMKKIIKLLENYE